MIKHKKRQDPTVRRDDDFWFFMGLRYLPRQVAALRYGFAIAHTFAAEAARYAASQRPPHR